MPAGFQSVKFSYTASKCQLGLFKPNSTRLISDVFTSWFFRYVLRGAALKFTTYSPVTLHGAIFLKY